MKSYVFFLSFFLCSFLFWKRDGIGRGAIAGIIIGIIIFVMLIAVLVYFARKNGFLSRRAFYKKVIELC